MDNLTQFVSEVTDSVMSIFKKSPSGDAVDNTKAKSLIYGKFTCTRKIFFWHNPRSSKYRKLEPQLILYALSCHFRYRRIRGLVPCLRVCCWNSLQRHWCRLPCLLLNEGRRDSRQDRWHEMVDILGHLRMLLRRWVLLVVHLQDHPLLLAHQVRFLHLVHGSDRAKWKLRDVSESHPPVFLETPVRFVKSHAPCSLFSYH